ncbi:MAG: Response regulator [Massilia sp.]|nr:Response regulator [Massilia sp.]
MGSRILIIEDNPTNMELMAYLLSAFGHTPLSAFDGEAGVLMAQQEQPELILCDVHLPKLDGYGVVGALKADPRVAAIPVLAVTALAMVGDRERLLGAGFDGYVAKPIEPEQFVSQLESFLAAPTPRAGAEKTLLIVDDDQFMLDLLRDILEPEGYRVVTAVTAADAIALVGAGGVQVIVCDQCMPLMTGTAFFERARQLAPACYRIMLTAMEANEPLRLAEERGDIDRRIGKPFDGAALRAAVAEGFRVQAVRAASAQPAAK